MAMRRERPTRDAGFTLVELVMVMLIVGVLAVFALPRLLDLTSWRLRAYGDELQAQMMAMQRLAVAQRRAVQATLSTSGVSFAYVGGATLASLPCPAAATPCLGAAASATFNSGNSGRTATSTGSALTVTLGSGAGAQVWRLEHETGLFRPAP
ncbi:Prepilin-type N-terminal cleavage/methylation domain-containing protein [Rubrivivax sp. A210]|uniref:type IV pilin protein n=1 Tax=Rubrivivax sp. A210 TaxID=2772301 RepID=UPI001918F117|nr:prepilin-type N-terminal cleavage/methylation domain-containing protein [Rubrivivax sp. A210]CAD5370275.1 Prepilin-type N-terminal cleavage/methylation domain-containing protein [Rubrivivax sp. A210]